MGDAPRLRGGGSRAYARQLLETLERRVLLTGVWTGDMPTLMVTDYLKTVVVVPAGATVPYIGTPTPLPLHGSAALAASAWDQFGQPFSVPPMGWSIDSGGGSIDANGLFTAGAAAGTVVVRATSGAVSGTLRVTVVNTAPTIATPAAAALNGNTAALSVLGADDGYESNLTYTWSATAEPAGATPLFSINGTHAAANTGVTFDRAGLYTLQATISDGTQTAASSVNVTVNQTFSTIVATPASGTLHLNDATALNAVARDQFGQPMAVQPAFTWTRTGVGSISGATFNSQTTTGSATVTATSGTISGSAGITVSNAAPTVATAATAPATITGATAALSGLGADDGGEANLTYTWLATTLAPGATVTYSRNASHAAQSATATFNKVGNYTFRLTISDGALSVTSSVSTTVTPTITSVTATATTPALHLNQSTGLSATGYDQFGAALAAQPTFTWSKLSGVGSVSGSTFTSAGTAGTASVQGASGGVSGSATITVTDAAPTVAIAASAPPVVTGVSAALSVLGADDGGESHLTYTWSTVTAPAGAALFYSANATNAAKSAVVTFNRAGSYTLKVTISDSKSSVSSQVSLTVAATVTTILLAPASGTVYTDSTTAFAATAQDQFTQTISSPGTIAWSLATGSVGSVNAAGIYSAGDLAGSATVRATLGGVTGTATLQVVIPVVTLSTQTLTGFTDLVVQGTTVFDTVTVVQSGTTFTVTSHNIPQVITGNFQDLVIHAGSAGSAITVDASVTIPVRLYGGSGADNLHINASGSYNAIVSIGGGNDTLTGNGTSTYFWADTTDTVNATAADVIAGRVHQVAGFYQPFSTDPANPNYIPLTLAGQNLPDPTDAGTEQRSSAWSLFGTAPVTTDVRQGAVGDCYVLAALGSLAMAGPARIYRSVVDLGDGTFAVRFQRNGVDSIVRVDADLALTQAAVSPTGGIWIPIIEKAYAFYRYGANTFASLDSGSIFAMYLELACTGSNLFTNAADATLANTIQNALAAGQALAIGTGPTIFDGAPLIESHAYIVLGSYFDSTANAWMLQIRNVWGFDGFNVDSNPNDGVLAISFDQLRANTFSVVDGM